MRECVSTECFVSHLPLKWNWACQIKEKYDYKDDSLVIQCASPELLYHIDWLIEK